MRRLKRSTTLLQRSRNCLRGDRASAKRRDFARIKSRGRFVVPTVSAARGRNAGVTPAATVPAPAGLRSRLVKAKNVCVACSDLTQMNTACRDIRVAPTLFTLALLSCDGTQAQECEHYSYGRRYDRFGRKFHCR